MIRDAYNENDESKETEEIITEIFIKPYFIGDIFAEKGDEQLYTLLQHEREIYNEVYYEAAKILLKVKMNIDWGHATGSLMKNWMLHMDTIKARLRELLAIHKEYESTTSKHYNLRKKMTPQERITTTEDQLLRLKDVLKEATKTGDKTIMQKAKYGIKRLYADLTLNAINRNAAKGEDHAAEEGNAMEDKVFTDKQARDLWYVLKRTILFGPDRNDTKGYIDWPREMMDRKTDLDIEDVNNEVVDFILDEEGYNNMKNILKFSTGGRMMQEQMHIIHKAFAKIIRESKAKGFYYSKFPELQDYIDKKTKEYAMMIKNMGRQGILNALKVVPETKAERREDTANILNDLYRSFYGSHGGARTTRRNRKLKAKRKHTRRA